jgi:hypothetical protein
MPKLDYQRIYLSGGGARLNGLREYLEKKTNKIVQVLDISSGLDLRKLDAASARCFEGEVPDMAVALGLAIIDADPSSFHFRLLPEKIVQQRVFWRKTVFATAAGVVLMAGLYLPYQNSSQAAQQAADEVGFYVDKHKKHMDERKKFVQRIEDNKALAVKVEYYARQTRMDRIYLELFTRIRAELPKGVSLAYFGPSESASSNEKAATGRGFGTWPKTNEVEDGVRDLIVLGSYEAETKFNEEWDNLRGKLLTVAGVIKAEKESLTLGEAAQRPGIKSFQLNLGLVDPAKQLLIKAKP